MKEQLPENIIKDNFFNLSFASQIKIMNLYLEQFEYRRNLHMKDYISNGIYNVYQGSSDPLLERRKDVQNKLEKVKNKLLNEEAARMERLMKKVDKENHLLDDIILNQEYPKK